MYSFTTKVSSVFAMFINGQGRSYLKSLVMILCFDDTSNCSNLIYFMSRLCLYGENSLGYPRPFLGEAIFIFCLYGRKIASAC